MKYASIKTVTAITLIAISVCGISAYGQEIKIAKAPIQLGFDPSELSRFEKRMASSIDMGEVVGCAALVCKNDQVVYSNHWGMQDRKNGKPVSDSTIWRIYSMTKPITSVAVMQLVESGKIGLDDPASKFLPEFSTLRVIRMGKTPDETNQNEDSKREPTERADREMTIRDLLRHTSGLTYGFFGDTKVDQKYRAAGVLVSDKTLKETTSKLGRIPLLHQPGTRFQYGVSTDVLARIVEVVSKKSFREYLRTNVFDPLQMNDTHFMIPKEKQDRLAELYTFSGMKLQASPRRASARFLNPDNRFYSGGGGLCSTMKDYLRFSRMMLNGGELDGKRILTPESVKAMTRNQLPEGAARRGFRFGLGFQISRTGIYSWGGVAGTRFWIDPQKKLITLFMIQIRPYPARHGTIFKNAAYDALKN